jgi:hypothetical protein
MRLLICEKIFDGPDDEANDSDAFDMGEDLSDQIGYGVYTEKVAFVSAAQVAELGEFLTSLETPLPENIQKLLDQAKKEVA